MPITLIMWMLSQEKSTDFKLNMITLVVGNVIIDSMKYTVMQKTETDFFKLLIR